MALLELIGGFGNDILLGGDGNDFLYGLTGFDTLTGGTGADNFVLGGQGSLYYQGAGYANITDWNPFEGDRIFVDANSLQSYTLQIGNYGSGTTALDTALFYQNDLVAVAADSAAYVLLVTSNIILTPV